MVLVTDKQYYLSSEVKKELDFFIECADENWDIWGVVDGMEGTAKSTWTLAAAYYVNYTRNKGRIPFNLDNVVFTPDQFNYLVDNAPDGTVIVWDEFVTGGISGDAATAIQKTLIKKAVTMRKKNMFVFLLIPYVFLLRKYFAISRPRFLVHVYTPDGKKRGYFKWYGYQRKKELYIKGHKFLDYSVVRADFQGQFKEDIRMERSLFFNYRDYDAKKEEAIQSLGDDDKEKNKVQKYVDQRNNLIMKMLESGRFTQNQIAEYVDMTQAAISTIAKKVKKKNEGLNVYL